MQTKFVITLADGSKIESHDSNWNQVKDHAHALSPHNEIPWVEYELSTDTGTTLSCIFASGMFKLNGTLIHPADEGGGAYTFKSEPQTKFEVSKEWQFLQSLPYFPVVGRRTFSGEWGSTTLVMCGWKRMEKDLYTGQDKLIEKLAFIHDNGQIILT